MIFIIHQIYTDIWFLNSIKIDNCISCIHMLSLTLEGVLCACSSYPWVWNRTRGRYSSARSSN